MTALDEASKAPPLLELVGIEKSFPGVRALSGINFTVKRGSVHVICGENGAGKSTLVKIINGIYQPDAGEIRINGQPVRIESSIHARELRISMIFQELNYIPENTIEQHLFLGMEPLRRFGNIDWKTIRRKTLALMEAEHLSYSPTTKLRDLTVSDIQMIEILKAVSMESNVILMDEPTSAITQREVGGPLRQDRQAPGPRRRHHLHLPQAGRDLPDRRRDHRAPGRAHVATRPASELNIDQVIGLMVGRSMENLFPERRPKQIGETVLEVEGLTRAAPSPT